MEPIEWEPWLTDAGLTTERFPNGNVLGSTAEAIALLSFTGAEPEMRTRLCLAAQRYVSGPGVYSRYPVDERIEDTQIDDYLRVAATCGVWANRILKRMTETFGFLSIDGKPRARQWFYRFPGFVAHCKFSACLFVGVFGRLAWAASVWLCTRKPVTNQDAWTQTALMILTYKSGSQRSSLCDWACDYWQKKLPKPVSEICADYIGDASHPLVCLYREVMG